MAPRDRERADFFLQLLADYALINEISAGPLSRHYLHKVGIKYGLRLEEAYCSSFPAPGKTLSPRQFTDLVQSFIRELGGEAQVDCCDRTKVVLICRNCIFGLMTLKVPDLCGIIAGILGGIAARHFPYCKVTVVKEPEGASCSRLCRLVFYLSETPEAKAAAGKVFSEDPGSYLLTRGEIRALDEVVLAGGFLYSKFEDAMKNLLKVHQGLEAEYDHFRNEISFDLELGVIITDACCQATYLNQAAKELLEVDGVPLPLSPLLALLAEILATGARLRQRELAVTVAGNTRYFLLNATPVKQENGVISGTIGVFLDVTDRKQLEWEMLRMEKFSLVAELAAGTVHEIRNPLATLRGFLQLLTADFSLGSRGYEYCDLMIKEIDRANSILKEFLLLTRPAAPELRETDLHQVLEDICLLVESKTLLENVILNKEYAPAPLLAKADAVQLKQVFLNLATNAIQAMPEGGTLTVFTRAEHGKIHIAFRDTGCGISPGNQDKIFDPFFTTKEQGTGLGLSVSYRIIRAHNGKILVDSTPGYGSTFSVELPAAGLDRSAIQDDGDFPSAGREK